MSCTSGLVAYLFGRRGDNTGRGHQRRGGRGAGGGGEVAGGGGGGEGRESSVAMRIQAMYPFNEML